MSAERWIAQGSTAAPLLNVWLGAIDAGLDAVAELAEGEGERFDVLRAASPLVFVLDLGERQRFTAISE